VSEAAAAQFVCSLRVGCDWSSLLGFGFGVIAGLSFVPLIHLTFAWTAYLLKKRVGRATLLGDALAGIAASVVAGAWMLVPLLPVRLVGDHRAYLTSVVWGVFLGVAIHRYRECRQS
jgi:uncharacterized membrane protein YcfT